MRTLAAFVALAAVTAFGAVPLLRQDEKKPLDEESLFAAAEKSHGEGRFRDAERLYEEYLDRFPSGKRRESVSYQRAFCEYQQRKYDEAREHFAAFQADYPKSEQAPWAQYYVAVSLADQRKKDDAVREFKKLFKNWPDTPATESALWRYWNLVGKGFQFSVHQSFTEGEEAQVHYYLHDVDKVRYRLYRVEMADVAAKVEKADKIDSIQHLIGQMPRDAWKKIKEWDEEPKYENRRYKYGTMTVPAEEAGCFILEAEHDEIAVHVNVIVARYGIVLKTAKGMTIAFAVDRRSSKPVPGMKIRVFDRGQVFEGVTDEQGLYALNRETNGAVVGIRDGEVALSNVSTWVPAKELKAYLFTDRPVYRPNQTVSYKAILSEYDSGRLDVLTLRKVRFEIRDPKGNVLLQGQPSTNEFGSFAGEVVLGDEPALGYYRMTVTTEDGRVAYGQFRVEEYRKPEYKVDVRYPKAPHLQGEVVAAEIEAKYYFGSPVVDAEVSYTITRRQHYRPRWYWRWDPYDWDLDDESYSYRGRYYREEELTRGSGRTDKDGKLAVSFKSEPLGHDVVYTVKAKVADKSRREVEGAGSCKAGRALVELSLSANRYVYQPGDSITLKVRATDTEGKAVPDLQVRVAASTSRWVRHEKGGAYEHDEFYAGSTATDANGLADLGFTVEKEGYVRLLASAKDRKGNEVKTDLYIWVSGRAWSADFQNFNGIEIVPDKTSYQVGETAKILLASQHKNVHALVTLECDGVYRHQVVLIKGHTALVEIPIDRAEFAPNVYFSVAALVKNEFIQRSKVLSVPPRDRLLNVKVTMNQSQYRPREAVTVTVEATDQDGKPVRGEFAVSIVDESIYAIQEEIARDFRKFLYSRRPNRVQTTTSLHYRDYGRAGQKEGKSGDGYGGRLRDDARRSEEPEMAKKKDRGMADTETRSEFPDTMFWKAQVVTDANGRATFEMRMPDSLTTWRTTVRGLTADAKVGQQLHSVICRKEVIVRLETPRFFTQNDETVVSAVVHNYRDDVDEVQVSIEAEGVELVGEKETVLRLAKNEDKRVDWKVRVKKAGTATFTAKALTPKESDAMKLSVPILAHGALRFETKAGMVETSQSISIAVPKDAIPEASELRIVVSPSVASQILDALEYLAGYPYGCVEQTMSRFLPSVVTASTLRGLGLKNEKLDRELPEMVSQGLQRLYNFQHQDGGWGWWEADASHPFMTAYVVYGLAQARAADFPVDANVLERGAACLAKLLGGGDPLDTKAYMAFALAEAGKAPKETLLSLYDKRGELNNYSRGLLAMALHRAGDAERAATILANLDETAKVGEGYCYWEGNAPRHSWMDNGIECTAYILKAMVAIDPKNEKVHKVVRWLSAKRQGNRWYSTKDTAAAVYALSDYIAMTKELEADYALTVKLNGDPIVRERITKENLLKFDGVRILKAGQFNAGANEITIEKEGKGNLYYSVLLKYYESRESFEPTKGSIRVERTYARVMWDGKRRYSEPLKDGETVKSGEEIEVTLKVECDGNYEYVMIEDPLPSGFEVVKEDAFYGLWGCRGRWRWWYSRIEARDEKVCVAATYLRGGQTIQYTMRAETPGDFHVLPAFAYNMYAAEIAGSSGENRIKVTDR
ncbi:MAG: outer membrane protein assembly factor BamD [Planctomycetes bacterium]|nr:outer membrane protein assembly factor BamD [Planctomycetota bacterium]